MLLIDRDNPRRELRRRLRAWGLNEVERDHLRVICRDEAPPLTDAGKWRQFSSPYPHLVVSRSHGGPTKSRKAREVPLLPEAVAVVDSLADAAGRDRCGGVFPWLPETASWVRRYVRKHSRLRPLAETFHVHALRNTFATRWLERGGSIETLQKVLGHSTVALTERYGRLRPWAVAAEARRVADAGTVVGTVEDAGEAQARKSLQGW